MEGAQHDLVPGVVVHRLDAGKSTFDRDIGKEIVREPPG